MLHCPRIKADIAKSPDNQDTGITSAAVFFTRTPRFSAPAAPVFIEPRIVEAENTRTVVDSGIGVSALIRTLLCLNVNYAALIELPEVQVY